MLPIFPNDCCTDRICHLFGEVVWILGPVRLEQERMISWKRTMIRSLSFVVLLLVFGSGVCANISTTTTKTRRSYFPRLSIINEGNISAGHRVHRFQDGVFKKIPSNRFLSLLHELPSVQGFSEAHLRFKRPPLHQVKIFRVLFNQIPYTSGSPSPRQSIQPTCHGSSCWC